MAGVIRTSKVVIYLRDGEGKESKLEEEEIVGGTDVGYMAVLAARRLMKPETVVSHLLGLVEVKGNERRRLSALYDRIVCAGCSEIKVDGMGCHNHKPEWFNRPMPTTQELLAEHEIEMKKVRAKNLAMLEKIDHEFAENNISYHDWQAAEKKITQ
jgi:hypothetical protein